MIKETYNKFHSLFLNDFIIRTLLLTLYGHYMDIKHTAKSDRKNYAYS